MIAAQASDIIVLVVGESTNIRYVNIRETAGWSLDAAQAAPKMAALLAMAAVPAVIGSSGSR